MQVDATTARVFLERHQPFPPDERWNDDMLETLYSVRRFLEKNPDDSFARLLIRSPGQGDGHGHYVCIPPLLALLDPSVVANEIRDALPVVAASTRYWIIQFAQDYSSRLVKELTPYLSDRDEDTVEATILALAAAGTLEAKSVLEGALAREKREWARGSIERALNDFPFG